MTGHDRRVMALCLPPIYEGNDEMSSRNNRLKRPLYPEIGSTKVMHVIDLGLDATDEDIAEQTRKGMETMEAGGYAYCTIRGYDDDPRPLCEIPEVRRYCRRLYDLGFPAALILSTSKPELISRHPAIPELARFGLGALELWLIANDLWRRGERKLEALLGPEELSRFERDYEQTCRVGNSLCGV